MAKAAGRDSPIETALDRRSKRAANIGLEGHGPVTTPLAGDALTRLPLAAAAVGPWRWTARVE
jgi:hypothetical protein